LWNLPVALSDLLGSEAQRLSASLERVSESERFARLGRWIDKRLEDWDNADWNTERLFDHFMWNAPAGRLADMAKRVGWSTRSLRRLFAENASLSPKDVQLAGRHLDACALLRERPELDITEIAGRVGFFDHAAFTHSFRERIGLTPTEFRSEAHAFYERRP